MKKRHFADNYIINPMHPLTVNVIGAGGTGCQVVTALARINCALQGLGHTGLDVTVYDDDIVTMANLGRQLFMVSEVGANKADVLVTRINRFFDFEWEAVLYCARPPLCGRWGCISVLLGRRSDMWPFLRL